MKTDHTLTAARLRELMRYEDGQLYWTDAALAGNPYRTNKGPVGAPAGRAGRLQVRVDGVLRYVHRLIWLHQHGEWPDGQIDHIDGDKHNNRIENLRVLTNGENAQNVKRSGVTFERRKVLRPWRARIMVNGRSISLGYYDTEDDARAEYERAKRVYHPVYVTGVGRTA